MKIDAIKEAIRERDRLNEVINIINNANKEFHWIKITTPSNKEGIQINGETFEDTFTDSILKIAKRRVSEIESITISLGQIKP